MNATVQNNPIANNIATGRRLAARSVVMTALASFDCVNYRKQVIETPKQTTELRDQDTWGGIGTIDSMDEHAIDYEFLGNSRLLFRDKFAGGLMLQNSSMVDMNDNTVWALIEPYVPDLPMDEWASQLPNWDLQREDIIGIIPSGQNGLIIYMEVVEIPATSMVNDFGRVYVLNKRDDLDYLEPFNLS